MQVTLDLAQLGGLLVAIVAAFWAITKLLLTQTKASIDEKFNTISKHMQGQQDASARLERDLMQLKADLPRDYVRREDYTQAVATIMTKIDSLGLRVENMFKDLLLRTKE